LWYNTGEEVTTMARAKLAPRTDIQHVHDLIEHIRRVRDNGIKLGLYLMENGELSLGIRLIASVHRHDTTKFFGVEFQHMRKGVKPSKKLSLAVTAHNHSDLNTHHPEACGGIHCMDRLNVAEMICDWKARSVPT